MSPLECIKEKDDEMIKKKLKSKSRDTTRDIYLATRLKS